MSDNVLGICEVRGEAEHLGEGVSPNHIHRVIRRLMRLTKPPVSH